MTPQSITERFVTETADHRMTVLHDDGLYRHLRFRRHVWRPPLAEPVPSSFYWFDLITVPGSLFFQGDGESWTFRRIEDMFEFFRGQRINPGYWSEKLTSGRDAAMQYDSDLFRRRVVEAFTDSVPDGIPLGTGAALRRDVLDDDMVDLEHEESAREALEAFEHDGFRFHDTWEWSFRDYHWWFLWSLHAIVWGISVYDGAPITAWSGTSPLMSARLPRRRPEPRPAPRQTRRVKTVATVGGVL